MKNSALVRLMICRGFLCSSSLKSGRWRRGEALKTSAKAEDMKNLPSVSNNLLLPTHCIIHSTTLKVLRSTYTCRLANTTKPLILPIRLDYAATYPFSPQQIILLELLHDQITCQPWRPSLPAPPQHPRPVTAGARALYVNASAIAAMSSPTSLSPSFTASRLGQYGFTPIWA